MAKYSRVRDVYLSYDSYGKKGGEKSLPFISSNFAEPIPASAGKVID